MKHVALLQRQQDTFSRTTPWQKTLGDSLPYLLIKEGISYRDFMEFLWHLTFTQYMGIGLLELTVTTTWGIWFSWNKTRLGATRQSSHEILAKVCFLPMEYQDAHFRPTQFKDATDNRWVPLAFPWYKVSCLWFMMLCYYLLLKKIHELTKKKKKKKEKKKKTSKKMKVQTKKHKHTLPIPNTSWAFQCKHWTFSLFIL